MESLKNLALALLCLAAPVMRSMEPTAKYVGLRHGDVAMYIRPDQLGLEHVQPHQFESLGNTNNTSLFYAIRNAHALANCDNNDLKPITIAHHVLDTLVEESRNSETLKDVIRLLHTPNKDAIRIIQTSGQARLFLQGSDIEQAVTNNPVATLKIEQLSLPVGMRDLALVATSMRHKGGRLSDSLTVLEMLSEGCCEERLRHILKKTGLPNVTLLRCCGNDHTSAAITHNMTIRESSQAMVPIASGDQPILANIVNEVIKGNVPMAHLILNIHDRHYTLVSLLWQTNQLHAISMDPTNSLMLECPCIRGLLGHIDALIPLVPTNDPVLSENEDDPEILQDLEGPDTGMPLPSPIITMAITPEAPTPAPMGE